MPEPDFDSDKAEDLRKRAEDSATPMPDNIEAMAPEDCRRLIHDLHVHQLELEMQNEELQRAQQDLAASRERYFDLYDMAPVGYVTISEKGLILEANLTFSTMMGVARGNLIKQPFSQLVPREDQDTLYQFRRLIFETGEPQAWDMRMLKPDGVSFWARMEAVAMNAESSAPVCRLVMSDITKNKLIEQTQAVRFLLTEGGANYLLTDMLQALIDEAERLTGSKMGFCHYLEDDQNTISLQAWSTNTLNSMCTAEGSGKHYPVSEAGVWVDCIREGKPVIHNDYASLPHKKGLPEGHAPVVRELVVPVFRGNKIEALLGVGNKESGYTEADANIVRELASLALDIIVKKRSAQEKEKLQAQLIQSQKMEAIGLLAGGMAHDFNNMLAVIMGNAGLALMNSHENSPNRLELQEIMNAAERARELTMKLLTFSRREKIEARGVEVDQIIKDIGGMLSRTLPKNIDLMTTVSGQCVINCDQNQIQQALLNVCNNAADAMPMGGKLIAKAGGVVYEKHMCETCGLLTDGRYCLIQVSDTGIGMAPEVLTRITEPFFTTKGIGKGTGLGLSVTSGIVHAHQGHLHIQSKPGKGTLVEIILPMEDGTVARPDPKEEQKEYQGSETILVVDDEKGVLQMTGRLLGANGYNPLLANTGETALELYMRQGDDIAVVVLDLMMPGMDGIEVDRRLKELSPDVKVVFVSGFSEAGIAGDLLKVRNRRFVQKPFSMNALCWGIRDLIDGPEKIVATFPRNNSRLGFDK